MNVLHLKRLTHDGRPTVGMLHFEGEPLCFTIEDPLRQKKVKGDTRIWAGTFPLRWRKAGRWARWFNNRDFPGSLEVCGVPAFTDVLIHVGNTRRDTEGCILPNRTANLTERTGGQSKLACLELYKLVDDRGGEWQIKID